MITRIILTIVALPLWVAGLLMTTWAALIYLAARQMRHAEAQRLAYGWLIGHDQLGNTLAFGDPDETISSRAGKCARKGGGRPCYWLCRLLHLLDRDHCERSIEADEGHGV